FRAASAAASRLVQPDLKPDGRTHNVVDITGRIGVFTREGRAEDNQGKPRVAREPRSKPLGKLPAEAFFHDDDLVVALQEGGQMLFGFAGIEDFLDGDPG